MQWRNLRFPQSLPALACKDCRCRHLVSDSVVQQAGAQQTLLQSRYISENPVLQQVVSSSVAKPKASCMQSRRLAQSISHQIRPSQQAAPFTVNLVSISSHNICKKLASFASCGQIQPQTSADKAARSWGLAAQPHLGIGELMDATPALH